ncbi:MAG TPA: hypothetical protein VLE72_04440 [Candidatus Saccharimonadales bacterium]|nr:hypothetical protein [Candidatus Saccharimonadales bacterium]
MASRNDSESWVGWVAFASFMMVLVGLFQAFVGLTAIVKDAFFVVTENVLVNVDVTRWGWVHLILGIVIVAAGIAVMQGKVWARTVGVLLALISAVANLAFVPYYPIWSIIVIVIDVVVMHALIVHGGELS